MKKKLTLTIDDDVYDSLGELPRKVSISEVVSLFLKAMVADIQGMSQKELSEYLDSDPRRKEVRDYVIEKLGPMFNKVDSNVDNVKKTLGLKKEKKQKGL